MGRRPAVSCLLALVACMSLALSASLSSSRAAAMQGGTAASDLGKSVVRLTLSGSQLCTGTVAGDGWVLSAAHCFPSRVDWRAVRVQLWRSGTVGSGDSWTSALSQAPITRSGTKLPTSGDPGWSDVALLRTSSAMPSWAKTLPVALGWPALGTTLTAYGYGKTSKSGSSSTTLQKSPDGDLKRVSCGSVAPSIPWTAGHICSKGTQSTLWQGDSGGPLLWWVRGYWQQVGDFSVFPSASSGVHWQAHWAESDAGTRNWIRSQVTGGIASGTLLKNPASSNVWQYASDGYRHWVPDGRTLLCLRGSGHPYVDNWNIRRIETLPDAVGAHASCIRDSLAVDRVLYRGDWLRSSDGRYYLHLQAGDGNLVLYNSAGRAVWATNRVGGERLILQGDSNLVVYNASGVPLWASNTVGRGAASFVVQSDGNMVLYTAAGRPVWASNTVGR